MNSWIEIDIQNCTYYFFENLDRGKIKIAEKSYKSIIIYHIAYMMVKTLAIYNPSINPLHLVINKINRYIEENEMKFWH